MLLTLTTTHKPATDLGYLLHKNPANLHSLELSFGKAHVFYPEATAERCTAALLLDVDPVGLVRGKRGRHEGGTLDQYVNDRPYVLSSFLSVAMGRAFGTAMSGRSNPLSNLLSSAGSKLRCLTIRVGLSPGVAGKRNLSRFDSLLNRPLIRRRHLTLVAIRELDETQHYRK